MNQNYSLNMRKRWNTSISRFPPIRRFYTKRSTWVERPKRKLYHVKVNQSLLIGQRRGQDVIGTLDAIAMEIIQKTDIFRNGDANSSDLRLQSGVARTNCIDCLDRTNAAQFVIGKRVLGLQLQALGVIEGDSLEYDTDAMDMFTAM